MTDDTPTEIDAVDKTVYHTLAIGVVDGIQSWKGKPHKPPEIDTDRERPLYYKVGYILGTIIQAAVLVVLAWLGFA